MTSTKLNRILYILLFFIIVSLSTFAQSSGVFNIKGVIKDVANTAVDGATLYLKDAQNGQVVVQGISNPDGSFNLSTKAGKYVFSVTYGGSLSYQSDILQLTADIDLSVLKVKILSLNLKEIIVKATKNKPLLQVDGRKVVFNIQKSVTAQGTNILEAIKKTPGIMVSQDNNITLNGVSGALVMINGRQTYLQTAELAQLLKSMPSSDVKSIEIIKNPGAEYDAAGTGGIINIVLQKSTADGFNGSINNGIAYGKTLKQNTNLNLNLRNGKLNLFGSYNHNFGHFAMDYDNDRITADKIYLNANHDVDKRHSMGSTLGADYTIDTTQTLGILLNANFLNGPGLITPQTNIFDRATGELLQVLKSQSSYPTQIANRYNGNLNYRFKDGAGHTLDIDADYGFFDGATQNLSTNTFYLPNGQFQSSNNFLVSNSRDIKLFALKADYGFKLAKGKFVTGAKFSNVNAKNIFDQYDLNTPVELLDVNLSNTFDYQEQIAAGYVKYEQAITKKLSFDLGVRAENTHSEGNLIPRDGSNQSPVSVVRNYLNFFPTGSLTLKTDQSGTYNLSFSRRIDRPAYNDLNPFSYPIDELSSWKGNPFLQPQYANTLSLQYNIKNTIASLGYTHTSDLSGQITEFIDANRINMLPQNIGFQDNINTSITQQITVTNWWNMTVTGIGYYLQNKVGTLLYGNYNPKKLAGTINTQQTLKLPAKITGEIAAVFNSNSISGLNTYSRGNSQIDLGLQKNVISDKGTIRLAVTDIFQGNKLSTDSELNGLLLHTTFRGEYRQVRLNFTYRFGNNKLKSRESRESGLQNESQRL